NDALDLLATIASPRPSAWAEEIASSLVRAWLPTARVADWPSLFARLDAHARALHDLAATSSLAALATDRQRPLPVAIVGEFNAGKSTLINAIIGADVAPTGVLPTTATLHHLRYAPDPIARILFREGAPRAERIVPIADLRATLASEDAGAIRRVEVLLPIA